MAKLSADIGYFPETLSLSIGEIIISTLPGLAEATANLSASPYLDGHWIFTPPGGRIFSLPKTHTITHEAADGPEHLKFLVWALSFFVGMRLTTEEAGFVDATPLKRQTLVDFAHLHRSELERGMALAEAFWRAQGPSRTASLQWGSAVHALFLAQYPHALQYERFIYLYSALDACCAMVEAAKGQKATGGNARRITWMCAQFDMPVPPWAVHSPGAGAEVALMRNAALHEGLYMGEPLGFALHDRQSAENLPLEMSHLVSRFLVALLGAPHSAYVRTPVSIYQTLGLDL